MPRPRRHPPLPSRMCTSMVSSSRRLSLGASVAGRSGLRGSRRHRALGAAHRTTEKESVRVRIVALARSSDSPIWCHPSCVLGGDAAPDGDAADRRDEARPTASRARSPLLTRASGRPRSAGISQARALTCTTTREGKTGARSGEHPAVPRVGPSEAMAHLLTMRRGRFSRAVMA